MNSAYETSSTAGKINPQKTPEPAKFQHDSFESNFPEFVLTKTGGRKNEGRQSKNTHLDSKYHSRDITLSCNGESGNLQKSGYLKSTNLCSSSPLRSLSLSAEFLNQTRKYKGHEQVKAFENTFEDHSEPGKSMNPLDFPKFVEAANHKATPAIYNENYVRKDSVREKKPQAAIEFKSRVKQKSGMERKGHIHSEKSEKEQEILLKATSEAEIKKAQDQALRYVMAAERDRQRILHSSSSCENKYTSLEQSPPYYEHLNNNLDLVSYDERFSPVLRVNCRLVSGDYELAQAIAKFAEFKLLPQGTDLWCISHIDDRNFDNLIPLLIQMAENDTASQS